MAARRGKANLRLRGRAAAQVNAGARTPTVNRRQGKVEKRVPLNRSNNLISGDARLKIIQKNRRKLVDAREKLAQIAKMVDARTKIQKLRESRMRVMTPNGGVIRPVGSNIVMRTDRDGKISLSTNKSIAAPEQRDIHLAVRKQLEFLPNDRRKLLSRGPQARPPIHRDEVYSSTLRRGYIDRDIPIEDEYLPQATVRRTIHNDVLPMGLLMDRSHADWARRPNSISSTSSLESRRQQSMKITAKNDYMEVDDDWHHAYSRTVPSSLRSIKMTPSYVDLEAENEVVVREPILGRRAPTGVRARLDTPLVEPQTHGIFGQPKIEVMVPAGHRIVVSNLETSVSQDDIRELFKDIGDLLVARLVRPGTAEVIYRNLKDAQKAVDTYHNRQLDGQPMKCLLVNKRPITNPTAPALKTTNTLKASGGIAKKVVNVRMASNKLMPDINTIRKVLFHK